MYVCVCACVRTGVCYAHHIGIGVVDKHARTDTHVYANYTKSANSCFLDFHGARQLEECCACVDGKAKWIWDSIQ